jgi:predicted membrane protein
VRNAYFGIALVLLGFFILLDNLNIIEFGEIFQYGWPLILVFWGISLLTRHPKEKPAAPGDPAPDPPFDAELLHQSAVFGSLHVSVSSSAFKGGSLSTVFGDCVVDLSKCSIAPGEHELRVHGVFGNTTVIIPKDAAVTIAARAVLGSVTLMGQRQEGISSDLSWASEGYAASPSRLKVSISRVFGEVRVS